MSDGGAISNRVPILSYGGIQFSGDQSVTVEVITSHDVVQIGEAAFKRSDLLWAMGVVEEHHRPLVGPMGDVSQAHYECEICEDKGGPGPLDPCEECNKYGPLP